jgi:glycosyltransferase involved in cell wall biosynthesis
VNDRPRSFLLAGRESAAGHPESERSPRPHAPLRVLHVTEATVGGIRQHVHHLALGLDRSRFSVGVACPPVRQRCFGDDQFVADLRDQEVTLHLVPMRREPDPASDLLALVRLIRVARQYDVVHTHSSKAGFLGRLAARLAGVRATLYTPNAFAFLAPNRAAPLFFALERFAACFTDALIACSPSEARAAARLLPPERIHVIPNAVDVAAFGGDGATGRRGDGAKSQHLLCRSVAPSPGRPVAATVGMVARLTSQKAPEVFVRAAARVCRVRSDVQFWLIGDGELRAPLEALARQLGVGAAIQFLGHRRDVPDLLRALDLFVLTSRYEGLPFSVLEAMACGLPVIATRAPGTVDVVEDGVTGVLTGLDAPEETGEAILALLAAPQRARALGETGRRRVEEHFSLPAMLNAHAALYQELALRDSRAWSLMTR